MVKAECEFNVFIIPPNLWNRSLHSSPNSNVYDFLYAGKICVNPEEYIYVIREQISKQLTESKYGIVIPVQFVFCRSVGRCFTMVRAVQERMFKIKIFGNPTEYCKNKDSQRTIFLVHLKILKISKNIDEPEDKIPWLAFNSKEQKIANDNGNLRIRIMDGDDINAKRKELEEAIRVRQEAELLREKLMRKMLILLTKLKKLRAKSSEDWKKKFYVQKKLTPPIEKNMNALRAELEATHSKIVNIMRARMRDTRWIKELELPELDQESYDKLKMVTRGLKLKQDIEEIQRIVDEGKEKLTAEIKLHCQAAQEARYIQADTTRKNVQLAILRSKELAKMCTPRPSTPPPKL